MIAPYEEISSLLKTPSTISWNLRDINSRNHISKHLTYVHEADIYTLSINPIRPPSKDQIDHVTIWTSKGTYSPVDYLYHFNGIGSSPILSLSDIIWITDNKNTLLNTEEKNSKGDYIGNFFFVLKDEMGPVERDTISIDIDEIVLASIIRRNTSQLEFGLRFYEISSNLEFTADDRRIFSC